MIHFLCYWFFFACSRSLQLLFLNTFLNTVYVVHRLMSLRHKDSVERNVVAVVTVVKNYAFIVSFFI